MNDLFGKRYGGSSLESATAVLSKEMIDIQVNDPFVEQATRIFENILDTIRNKNLHSTIVGFKNPMFKNNMENLDELIYKRFGIKVRHIPDESMNYGVCPVPALNYNVLNNSVLNTYQSIKDEIKRVREDFGMKPTTDKVDDIENTDDVLNIYNALIKTFDGMDKHLKSSNVKIDLKNAKIHNLPEDYHIMIFGDIVSLLTMYKVDPKEMTAILLHEIGHAFTHIEYMYRTYNNTAVLVDSMKDSLIKKKSSLKKTLVIAYEASFGEKMTEVQSSTSVTALITMVNRYIADTRYLTSYHSYTDSEQLADQFAGRFGVGPQLASGLKKFYDGSGFMALLSVFVPMIMLIMVIGFIATMSIIGAIGITVIWVILNVIINMIVDFFTSISTKGGALSAYTYDENKQRINRIKNEAVRSLRLMVASGEIDKDLNNTMLQNILSVVNILELLPEDKVGFFDSIARKLTSGGERLLDAKKFEQELENLQENDLHISAAKLRSLMVDSK